MWIWLWTAAAWAGTWTLTEEVVVPAPPHVVWAVLVDFAAYDGWNPWLIEAAGEPTVGARVVAHARLGDQVRRAAHEVTAVAPHERFCWKDLGWFTPLARGTRCRTLAVVPEGTRLRVELTVTGAATGMVVRRYGREMASGMRAELDALAAQAGALDAEPRP